MKTKICNNFINILFVVLMIIMILYLILRNKKRESFESIFSSNEIKINNEPKIDKVELNLCNPELTDDVKKENINKGIDLIYDNHYQKNIKKFIDNYVDLQYLTDKIGDINKSLYKHIHKNKKYNTDGEITFV